MTSFVAPATRPSAPANWLLAKMSGPDLALLQPHMKPVSLRFRQRLESGQRKAEHAFFIEQGLASIIAMSSDRRQAEVGLVGWEGMTGVSIVLGVDRAPNDIVMQVEGSGQCIAAEDLRKAMRASSSLSAFLLRYVYAAGVQMAHTALANAQGKIEERLARWLLMAHDRTNSNELSLTHEFLAVMLGVRRPGVTMALHQLEIRGMITTGRGSIGVVDRNALEKSANGLYGTPEVEFKRQFAEA